MIVRNKRSKNYWGARKTGRYSNSEGIEWGLTKPGEEDYGKIIRRVSDAELKDKFEFV